MSSNRRCQISWGTGQGRAITHTVIRIMSAKYVEVGAAATATYVRVPLTDLEAPFVQQTGTYNVVDAPDT